VHTHRSVSKHRSDCRECQPKRKAHTEVWSQSAAGKASASRRQKKFGKSEKGLAKVKRFQQSEKGKIVKKKTQAKQQLRRQCDPAYALIDSLRRCAANLVSGRKQSSPKLMEYSTFESAAEFVAHVTREATRKGFEVAAYGVDWSIDHIIPCEAYDFANRADIARCWSASNVTVLPPKENSSKKYELVDELCQSVGADKYPAFWNGRLLTPAEKDVFYARMKESWQPPTQQPSDESGLESDGGA
jgi:hypothetical protein